MAQTRAITGRKVAAINALDFASRAFHAVWRPPQARSTTLNAFLILEPWGIGDVVLSTALMRALRVHFPGARITLLAKAHARDLLDNSGLVDEVIVFDFPWTAFTGKLAPRRYVPKRFHELIQQLRQRDFDVSFDARRDIRSNVISYFAGARRRIGYDSGGGAHLLTDPVESGNQNEHKVRDWLALLSPLGIQAGECFAPTLTVTEGERANARERIRMAGLSTEKLIVGVHPGASQKVRKWSPEHFAAVIDKLSLDPNVQCVVFEEHQGDSASIAPLARVPRLRGNLRDLMALIAGCDALLCADSGPMHIANALGVPVTALFGPQRREWYGPRGETDYVVQVDEMPCRPCFDACIFATPHCMDGITVEKVSTTVARQLERIAVNKRIGQA